MPDSNFPVYSAVEHSGDLRIVVSGEGILEAIAHASFGLVDQIVSSSRIEERELREIEVSGEDETTRIIALLNRLLYLVYVRKWVPRRVTLLTQCSSGGCLQLKATLAGEPVDPTRHEFKYDIKAVTYHDFSLQTEGHRTRIEFVCHL